MTNIFNKIIFQDSPEYGRPMNKLECVGLLMMGGTQRSINLWNDIENKTANKVKAVALGIITFPFTLIGAVIKGVGYILPHKMIERTDAVFSRTPPEIADQIYDMLGAIDELFEENDIFYTMQGGTMLGAVRHNGIIPWDDDADLNIKEDDVEKLLALTDQLAERGFELVKKPGDLYQLISKRGDHEAHVDIFLMKQFGNIWTYKSPLWRMTWPNETMTDDELNDMIENGTKYSFGPEDRNVNLRGIREPERYLSDAYGEDWNDMGYLTQSHGRWPWPFSFIRYKPVLYKERVQIADRAYAPGLEGEARRLSLLTEKERRVHDKWINLGLDPEWLQDYEDAAFLIDSKMIYSILGFQNTPSKTEIGHIKFANGKLQIRAMGTFVNVENLRQDLEYDNIREVIVDKNDETKRWMYLSDKGLVQVDRWNCADIPHVHEISDEDMDALRQHAAGFYHDDNPDPNPEAQKDCVLQIFTSPRNQLGGIEENPLMRGAVAHIPIHVAMRFVKDGKVYSFGYEMLPEQAGFITNNPASNLVATADAKLAVLDYEEMRAHEGRMVTSIPVSCEMFDGIIDMVRLTNDGEPLTFNYIKQSCAHIATHVLNKAGIVFDSTMKGTEFLSNVFPKAKNLPVIGSAVRAAQFVGRNIYQVYDVIMPECVKRAFAFIAAIFCYIPNKMATFSANILGLILGANRVSPGKSEVSTEEDSHEDQGILKRFNKLYHKWTDLFSDNMLKMRHSTKMIQWQLEQATTVVHPYAGVPSLAILPSQIPNQDKSDELKQMFVEKYVDWDR